MQKITLLLTLLCTSTIFADPLLVAVLMVKNEASVMATTLQPLVDAGIKDYFIYDTGSTDDTINNTKAFFKKNNITSFKIAQEPWIDFSASRNRALRLTEQTYPDAIFMLMLDAEWHLCQGKKLMQFCQQEKYSACTLYCMRIKSVQTDHVMSRLMRCHHNIEFVGKVHEIPTILPQKALPDDVYFEFFPTSAGKQKTEQRFLRDRDILLQEFTNNPNNPRTIMLLAQTYACLSDWANAAKWYEMRILLHDNDEADCMATYRLANAYQVLQNYEKMIFYHLQAFAMRPQRAEPLIRLAIHYFLLNEYNTAFLFAKHTATIPYPENEAYSVEKELYTFIRYDLLSRLAYGQGEYEIGLNATKIALLAQPNSAELQNNLKIYQKALNTK
jgi:tetratricopeptide (TPR) repeat protein